MDDIDRAQIGTRRETAHEQINHPKIPQTNLPSMKAIDKQYKKGLKFDIKTNWHSVITAIFLILVAGWGIGKIFGFF